MVWRWSGRSGSKHRPIETLFSAILTGVEGRKSWYTRHFVSCISPATGTPRLVQVFQKSAAPKGKLSCVERRRVLFGPRAFDHPAALIGWLSSDLLRIHSTNTLRSILIHFGGGAGVLKLDSLAQRISSCGLAIRICHVERRSGARHHELAGAPHDTPNPDLLHSSNHQCMVWPTRAGIACRSALHARSRLLFCAGEPRCRRKA